MKIIEIKEDIGTKPVTIEFTAEEVLSLWVISGSAVAGDMEHPTRILTENMYDHFCDMFGASETHKQYLELEKTFKGVVTVKVKKDE